jgi:crossover junction endodeoxyribonuclease RusA
LIELLLPFPPSINHYLQKSVRRAKGRSYVHVRVSDRGIQYRAAVLTIIMQKRLMRAIKGRVRLDMYLFPPNIAERDVDNYPKVLLDSLTHAKFWEDDECVDKLTVTRAWPRRPEGACLVRVYDNFNVSSEFDDWPAENASA